MSIRPDEMRNLEAKARALGERIGGQLVINGKPHGFALILFTFDGTELTYISNAQREDMIKALQELLDNFKRGKMTDYPGGIDARN